MATVKPNLADQAQRALAAGDITRAYCIEAAAGTGKTTLLVDRLLSIVRTGAAELRHVAAITFTEKAAGELRVRLRQKLEEGRRQADGRECENFSQALEQLDRASISTIHAFAASLLRERPVEAGVDPGFEQLDEMGSQLLFDEVWRKWKERQLQEAPAILRRLLALDIDLDRIRMLAVKLLENRDLAVPVDPVPSESVPDLPGWEAAAASPIEQIWDQVVEGVEQLKVLAKHCTTTSDRGFRQIQRLAKLVALTPADELARERMLLLDLTVAGHLGAQSNWLPASACAEQKEICKRLKAAVENAPLQLGPSLTAAVLAWLWGFLQEIEQEKRRRGVLDFQDLLLKARDLLRDHPEVRAYFQARIRFLLVDEFQDTDPLQAEMVFYLAEQGAKANDWQQVKLARDKLFLVGDPKQSIYRFRRADMQIYQQAKQMMARLHAPLVIHQNFRSSPAVLKTINGLFERQMVADDYQADYVPLTPAPQRPDPGPGLALLFPPDSYVPRNMPEYFQAEAELLARWIKRIVQAGDSPVKIWDRHKEEARSPNLGDLAILFPVTSGLGHYEEALRTGGIPFQVDAGRQFYARRETCALLSVLTAVDNPEDAIAVVAALRSPFFGLSDADLLLYRHAGGRFHYLRQPLNGFPRMAHCFGQLRRWHQARATRTLSALLDAILDESCILQFCLLLSDGEQVVANLLRVVQLARRFETQPGACPRAFVAWLEQRAAAELAEAETAFADEQEDAVHLLTVHAAKGLEFPVVALASLACSERQAEDVLLDHAARQIGISLKCGSHRLNTANFSTLLEAEQKRGRAEDLRLLYVAATRARDCLVLPRLAPEPGGRAPRFLDFLDPALRGYGKPKQTTCADGVLLLPAEDLPQIEASANAFRRNLGLVEPANDLVAPILAEREAWQAGLAKIGLAMAGQEEQTIRERFSGQSLHAGAAARILGSAFHRVMRTLEVRDDQLLASMIDRIAAAEGITSHREVLKSWVERALSSPLWGRVRNATKVWRELPFASIHEGEVKEGSIDLLFEEDGELVLVDYKTDDVKAAELPDVIESHRAQLELYCHAVGQLTGKHPREVLLYFVRLGRTERIGTSGSKIR